MQTGAKRAVQTSFARIILLLAASSATILASGSFTQSVASSRSETLWEPPSLPWPSGKTKPTVDREMIPGLHVDGYSIKLETTSLASVQDRFGGTLGHSGDAGETLDWLCLYKRDPRAGWALWLTGDELDHGQVSGFQWQRMEAGTQPDRRCQQLPGDTKVELPVSLQIGMSRSQVEKLLGQPTLDSGENLYYAHQHEISIHGEPFTVSNSILISFHEQKVSSIAVEKTTIN